VKAKYGLSATSLNRTGWLDSYGGAIAGLKPNTKYYFSVQAIGVNGNSKISKFSIVSPRIPPKPRSSGSSGGSGGSSGGSVFVVGMRLDRALALLGSSYSYVESAGCRNKTWFGIVNTSSWIVVAVSGGTLYACKP
jgi:hypothetical protein